MNNNLRVKAIILRRTNYGEADRIITVLTREQGILSVMARGVRREKSRLAGGIELFSICDLTLAKGRANRSDLWTLTGAKIVRSFYDIIEDFGKMEFGYEAIKLAARAAEDVDEPEYFDLLEKTFANLNNSGISRKITEAWFYLNFAKIGGAELNARTDKNGMNLVEDARYIWDGREQVFTFAPNGKYGVDEIKILRILSSNLPAIVAKISGVNDFMDNVLLVAKSVAKL